MMENIKYHAVGTVPNSNRQIVVIGAKLIS